MIGEFWRGVGGRLAERWVAALFSPAFAFWVGGLLAWLARSESRGGGWTSRALAFGRELQGQPAIVQGICVVAPLTLIVLSGLALQQLAFPVLRALEGYWPAPFAPLAHTLRERLSHRSDVESQRLRQLAARSLPELTAGELAERARLERRHRRLPAQRVQRMPTRLGNSLRAAESRIRARYGLDPIVCWPRLWLLLPDTARQETTAAYASMLLTVQVFLCGVLFTVWTVWSWWALPVGLLVAAAAYARMLPAASAVGDVVESCFDVHRRLLYQAAHWPLPTNPRDERAEGTRLTTYLHTGSRSPEPTFVQPTDFPSSGP
ncbi:hypothetical protein [Streptomyces sp. NRRL S-37]|uniref:hypothetical protein n=1 Tax=Streptomyces sp. NRRL S-37 TaxID=1463903 RepID=UPI0004C4857C|nr:hypothetical protein [Streptomyces sp. NRRL S-37]